MSTATDIEQGVRELAEWLNEHGGELRIFEGVVMKPLGSHQRWRPHESLDDIREVEERLIAEDPTRYAYEESITNIVFAKTGNNLSPLICATARQRFDACRAVIKTLTSESATRSEA